MAIPESPIIIVGAGIAGLCAAHQATENGANVILLDKNLSTGGNSRLARTGINGFQKMTHNFSLDTPDVFKDDLIKCASNDDILSLNEHTKQMIGLLCDHSTDSIDWLETSFNLKFDKKTKTHDSTYERTLAFQKNGFPGSVILQALLNDFKLKCEQFPGKYMLLDNSKLVDFIVSDSRDEIIGIVHESAGLNNVNLFGLVILATGGFGSSLDFIKNHASNLTGFATASANSCNSEVIELALKFGSKLTNMENYQMTPTGLVPLNSDTTHIKSVNICPESIINEGVLINDQLQILNKTGNSNEEICKTMAKAKRNYLILNDSSISSQQSTFKSLERKGYLKKLSLSNLTSIYFNGSLELPDLLRSRGISTTEPLIIQLMPTVLLPLGGLKTTTSMEIEGLNNCFAAGEIIGGVHGLKMIVGSSLLSCVVSGRLSAQNATKVLLSKLSNTQKISQARSRLTQLNNHLKPFSYTQFKIPETEFTLDEIAKHKDIRDCWLVIKNVVLNVSSFIENHPGGINSMLINGGCDISDNYEMLHDDLMIFNFARDCIIGRVKGCVPYLEFMDGE